MTFSEFDAIARQVVADLCPVGHVTTHENGLLHPGKSDVMADVWTMHIYPDGILNSDSFPSFRLSLCAQVDDFFGAANTPVDAARDQIRRALHRALENRAKEAAAQ